MWVWPSVSPAVDLSEYVRGEAELGRQFGATEQEEVILGTGHYIAATQINPPTYRPTGWRGVFDLSQSLFPIPVQS